MPNKPTNPTPEPDGQSMATTSTPEEQLEQTLREGVLAYRCPAHPTFFPGENPLLPYSEFVVDPITLKRTHDRACKACVSERRRSQTTKEREERALPPLERIRLTRQKLTDELRSLRFKRGDWSEREMEIKYILRHLAEQEQALQPKEEGH